MVDHCCSSVVALCQTQSFAGAVRIPEVVDSACSAKASGQDTVHVAVGSMENIANVVEGCALDLEDRLVVDHNHTVAYHKLVVDLAHGCSLQENSLVRALQLVCCSAREQLTLDTSLSRV